MILSTFRALPGEAWVGIETCGSQDFRNSVASLAIEHGGRNFAIDSCRDGEGWMLDAVYRFETGEKAKGFKDGARQLLASEPKATFPNVLFYQPRCDLVPAGVGA